MERTDNETIVQLIQSEQGDRNELLTELWENNIRLVRKIISNATGYNPDINHSDYCDLEQQAFLGIMDSIGSYDPDKGYKFFTHATPYIRKSIYRYFDRAGQTLRIPEYMQTSIRKYFRAKREIESEGKKATSENIRERLGISWEKLKATEKAIQQIEIESLDSYIDNSNPELGTLIDMIQSNENIEQSVTDSVYQSELHEILRKAIKELPGQEKGILDYRHYQGMSLESIGTIYGFTKEGIRENLQRAYRLIRTGQYGNDLTTFLTDRQAQRATAIIEREKKIDTERLGLTEKEKDLLL